MKVAIVNNDFSLGGIQRVAVTLANYLSNNNDVSLVSYRNDSFFYETAPLVKKVNNLYNNSTMYKISKKIKLTLKVSGYNKILSREFTALKQHILEEHYDVVIACAGNTTMLLGPLVNEVKNTKFIAWMHNTHDTYFNNYYKGWSRNLADSLMHFDAVVTLTLSDKEKFIRYNPNTLCIYNPITINTECISNLDRKEVLSVCRLAKEQKGLDYLVDSFVLVQDPEWVLRIIGEGPDKLWLEKYIQEKGLQHRIILEGAVSKGIEEFYKNASIFVSTSRWEGFGLVITEAMEAGLPIVSFNNSGPCEILGNGKYGKIVDVGDTVKLATELNDLISNFQNRKEYSDLSVYRASFFKIDVIGEEWMDLFKIII